jgi:hypothetical protein
MLAELLRINEKEKRSLSRNLSDAISDFKDDIQNFILMSLTFIQSRKPC